MARAENWNTHLYDYPTFRTERSFVHDPTIPGSAYPPGRHVKHICYEMHQEEMWDKRKRVLDYLRRQGRRTPLRFLSPHLSLKRRIHLIMHAHY